MNLLHPFYHFLSIEMKFFILRVKITFFKLSRRLKWLQPV